METRAIDVSGKVSQEKLMQDLRILISDAEELMRVTAAQTDEKITAARIRIQESLAVAREHLASMQADVVARARQAAKATDEYVHDNPWISMGVVAGASLVAGMLIARNR